MVCLLVPVGAPAEDVVEFLSGAKARGEVKAIRRIWGEGSTPPISSTKSLTGHSLGATGVHEAIYALLMQQNDFIAASANIENLDPACGNVPIVRERWDGVKLDRVMSNSFGFGGTNASLVFQRYDG